MLNNYILRNVRYSFNFNDDKMIDLFAKGDLETTRPEISNWLKKEEDEAYQPINDFKLASFLNGFIIQNRGKQDGVTPVAEKKLTNNIILRKFKIALNLKDDDVLDMLEKVDLKFSKHELSAFFRKPDHKHYRQCKDQILRNFIYAMKEKYRVNEEEKKE
jgi:uncharacterized protein YehS (DUF1456 family)